MADRPAAADPEAIGFQLRKSIDVLAFRPGKMGARPGSSIVGAASSYHIFQLRWGPPPSLGQPSIGPRSANGTKARGRSRPRRLPAMTSTGARPGSHRSGHAFPLWEKTRAGPGPSIISPSTTANIRIAAAAHRSGPAAAQTQADPRSEPIGPANTGPRAGSSIGNINWTRPQQGPRPPAIGLRPPGPSAITTLQPYNRTA